MLNLGKHHKFSVHLIFALPQTFASKIDPYRILGISKGASTIEIKRAYYEMAQKYHPDKNTTKEAHKIFEEINQAYQILSNEAKKSTYDSSPIQSGATYYYNASSGVYSSEEFTKDYADEVYKKGTDIEQEVTLTFLESVQGIKKIMNYKNIGECPCCKGSKCQPGHQPTKCISCNGKGFYNHIQGPLTIQFDCKACNGQGNIIAHKCVECKGVGVSTINIALEVDIPAGVTDKQNLRIPGKGNPSPSSKGPSGDFILKVKVLEDDYFVRDKDDVYCVEYISLIESLKGTQKTVQTLQGPKKIKLEPFTSPEVRIKLAGHGILNETTSKKGDQLILFKVIVPRELSSKEYELYQNLRNLSTVQ